MSIISNHLELRDPGQTAVYLPTRMTEAQFVAWCDSHTWAEWVDGKVILMSPVDIVHADLSAFLMQLVGVFVNDHELGKVIAEPFQIRLPRFRRRRSPDLFFVSNARLERLHRTHFQGGPNLVIEIISPESQSRDRREKFLEYQGSGVKEYWLIGPLSKSLEVYSSKNRKFVRVEPEAGSIHSMVVPGLYINPDWLWRSRFPSVSSLLKEMAGKR
jgi:Uma2 family endonuclease